ncbi:thioesterase family protein [Amycolatopsis alkalitolerans]|uniref:Thioesterase family protein n=1 Tax=Amycolatopsis alkalitolerans TaxID=2547244 RepID=A0A5C4LZN3_9PSEU|nr:thioesterase family protein [Amycolatopsis alkalitolerans]TNC25425.1 thioesterase family protein [Amycolatopsis alkalitolerans]
MSESAFYLPLGENRFQPTVHTAGPWTPGAQHFGPPSSLLARALEELPAERESELARVTVEILGPAPLTELRVAARIDRPGRSVELLVAELSAGARTVARASAWRLIRTESPGVANLPSGGWPKPEDCPPSNWPESWLSDEGGRAGYLDAVEWRSVSGGLEVPGPAALWGRQRVALVDGEEATPMQRLFAVADSGNGASSFLDPRRWWFINSELTVHVQRPPQGEWIGLDAATTVGPGGVGTAASTLRDLEGPVGFGAQALMVRPR